jgi:hypothetical protein
MFTFFWRKLPDVAHRRLSRRLVPKFGTRLVLFFVTFFVSFGVYVMSFVTGSEWGVQYGKRCQECCAWLGERLTELLGHVPIPLFQRVGDGIVRLLANDMAAVIAVSFLLAIGVVAVVSLVSSVIAVVTMFRGPDGSQAELYEEDGKMVKGAGVADARRRKALGWRPDVANNPYSVSKARK